MFLEFTFNPKLLFIIIYPILKEAERFISKQFIVKGKDHNLFKIFRLFFCNLLAIIFLLIFKCINKIPKIEIIPEENEKHDENEKYDDMNNEILKLIDTEKSTVRMKSQIRSYAFLFLLSVLYFGAYFYNYYVREDILRLCRNSIGIIFEIIIFYTLSFLILKEKYHKHHYLSISIIFVSLIALFIIYSINLGNSEYSIFNAFWYYLVFYILYGSFDVTIKKYFLVYFYSIYYVLLLIGVYVCVPLLLYDVIAFFIDKNASGVLVGFANNVNNVKSVFLFIVDLFFLFASNLGLFWTIYYFTPFHLIISEFFSELLGYYIQLIQFKTGTNIKEGNFLFQANNIAIFSVIFFINFICSLIFNEIIILKFLKLEYYTKKYIKLRAQSDANVFLEEISSASGSGRASLNES